MTITTSKFTLTFGQTEAVKLKRLDNERAEYEARMSIVAKETVLKAEVQLAKIKAEYAPQMAGDSYMNCSFGQPFRVDIPVPIQPIRGNDDQARSHAAQQLGIPEEMVQRVWDSIKQYYQDKNKPEQQ